MGIDTMIWMAGNMVRFMIMFFYINKFFCDSPRGGKIIRYVIVSIFYIIDCLTYGFCNISTTEHLAILTLGVLVVVQTYNVSWRTCFISLAIVTSVNMIVEASGYYITSNIPVLESIACEVVLVDILLFVFMNLIYKTLIICKDDEISASELCMTIILLTIVLIVTVRILDECHSEIIEVIGLISMTILTIAVLWLLRYFNYQRQNEIRIIVLEQEKKAYQHKFDQLSVSEKHLKGMRHDMKNHLLVIKAMIKEHDIAGLNEYIATVERESKKYDALVETGNIYFDYFINAKLSVVKEQLQIEPQLSIAVSNELQIDMYDMCIVVGNLLDNSIEALQKCDGGFLKIDIKESLGTLSLIVSNSCETSNEVIRKNLITNKRDRDKHGFGLENVRKIVEKYDGEMNFSGSYEIFTVNIIMYI